MAIEYQHERSAVELNATTERDDAPPHTDADAPPTEPVGGRRRGRSRPTTGRSGGGTSRLATLHRDERNRIVSSPANATIALRHDAAWQGVLEYEARTGRVVLAKAPPVPASLAVGGDSFPRELRDSDLVNAQAWGEASLGVTFGTQALAAAADAAARSRSRDPVREYLDGLRWDGAPRLDTWLARYLGAPDDAYSQGVGSRWPISAVARTYAPGCQADHMLVLEGRQGAGKSSALRTLAVRPEWYADGVPGLGTKDAADALRGPWLVEIAELDAFGKAELSTVKAFVSRTVDRYRESYGRRTADFPRRIVFAGSTNESAYLRDPTGARRFWPVRCGSIDLAALAADRDQLWAEAVARYRAGEPWHPDAALAGLASSAQDARYEGDAWQDEIEEHLDGRREITVRELAVGCLKFELARIDARVERRIVAALRRLGWTTTGNPVRRIVNDKPARVRVYLAPEDAPPSPTHAEDGGRREWHG